MMNVLARRATTTAEVKIVTSVFDTTTATNTDTESWSSVGKCIFWKGQSARTLVSDKIRELVDATACFEPTVTIKGRIMRINGTDQYEIVGQDDIANQVKVRVVYLKEIT